MKPYKETKQVQHGTNKEYLIRTFEENVKDEELVWHRDTKNRKVHILSGENWKLQMDDELPKELRVGHDYWILKETYHRLIKGNNNLVVRIENI